MCPRPPPPPGRSSVSFQPPFCICPSYVFCFFLFRVLTFLAPRFARIEEVEAVQHPRGGSSQAPRSRPGAQHGLSARCAAVSATACPLVSEDSRPHLGCPGTTVVRRSTECRSNDPSRPPQKRRTAIAPRSGDLLLRLSPSNRPNRNSKSALSLGRAPCPCRMWS